jgi:hypothetical protein
MTARVGSRKTAQRRIWTKLPATEWRPSPMRTITTKPRSKKAPKRVLALPDLEQSKAAVLNSLTSASGQRTYDHAIREFVA